MQKLADYIWLNGEFVPFAETKVHVLNHSLHYGSGVFEGIRCYDTLKGPAVFRLDDHIKRLFMSADVMGIKVPYSKEEVKSAILETIQKNDLKECYIRPLVFFGGKMGLDPQGVEINVMISAWPWGKYLEKEAVSVKISDFTRIHPKSSVMTAKISGHYANSILASTNAKREGFDEALLLDYKGNIAEGPGENIFFAKDSELVTPREGSILPGITRDTVIQIAKDLKLKVEERDMKPEEIADYKEAFFVGTAVEVNAIGKINDMELTGEKEGNITKKIRERYSDIIHGKVSKYEKLLSFTSESVAK
jgi:branched-chain amino acid aminotransferase